MLTPEQLAELDKQYICGELQMYQVCSLLEHVNAQQARIAELEKKLAASERERDHWKANHENQVRRARILMERPDMPIERVKAYQHMQDMEQRLAAETARADAAERDAARYRWLLANYARGDGWKQIDDALNDGEAETKLSPAIDAARKLTTP